MVKIVTSLVNVEVVTRVDVGVGVKIGTGPTKLVTRFDIGLNVDNQGID